MSPTQTKILKCDYDSRDSIVFTKTDRVLLVTMIHERRPGKQQKPILPLVVADTEVYPISSCADLTTMITESQPGGVVFFGEIEITRTYAQDEVIFFKDGDAVALCVRVSLDSARAIAEWLG